MLFEELLTRHYSQDQVEGFFQILPSAPRITTLRVNTLKYTAAEAKSLLEAHFLEREESFQVQISPDFPDLLLIPSIPAFKAITPADKEIVVDVECGAALLRGADLFAVGVLGMDESIEKDDLCSVWVDLEGKCLKGAKKASLNGLSKRFIGNGKSLQERKQVFNDQKGVAVKMMEMSHLQPSLNGVLEDVIFLQNLPSMLAARVLNPAAGSRVLDMCAAPGGKTTHLAQLMRNEGSLLAADKNAKKLAKIAQNCARFGIEIVELRKGDSRHLKEVEEFDYILLDPPCSGLGQRPSFLLPTTLLQNLSSFPAHQRELFVTAWKLLKRGGSLVYSTCTVNPAENEEMVAWILQTCPDAQLIPIRRGPLERLSLPGLAVEGLTVKQGEECLCRFWPDEQHDSIGFFMCKFQKI